MQTSDVAAVRRMGAPGSANWTAMLDGAEEILRRDGYGALTSRAVADQVGVKQRLVYYYFRTMDDLVAERFRRLAQRELERLTGLQASARPLREIWQTSIGTTDVQLVAEFVALAHRNAELREEVVAFVEASRAIQIAELTQAIARAPRTRNLPPDGLALLATSLALSINRETVLGVTAGHESAIALVEAFLHEAEPAPG